MKQSSYKLIEYTMLLFGVIIFALSFWQSRHHVGQQIIITAGAAVFYVIWGLVHHWMEKRLTLEIALEYVLMGAFTFLLVLIALGV